MVKLEFSSNIKKYYFFLIAQVVQLPFPQRGMSGMRMIRQKWVRVIFLVAFSDCFSLRLAPSWRLLLIFKILLIFSDRVICVDIPLRGVLLHLSDWEDARDPRKTAQFLLRDCLLIKVVLGFYLSHTVRVQDYWPLTFLSIDEHIVALIKWECQFLTIPTAFPVLFKLRGLRRSQMRNLNQSLRNWLNLRLRRLLKHLRNLL